MSAFVSLARRIDLAAARRPGHVAIEEPPGDACIRYRELASLSDRVRDRLVRCGVRPGDRVGIYVRKSIDAVAAILGSMKAGAAYVPVDPGAPAWRAAYVLSDCAVKLVIVESAFCESLAPELEKTGHVPGWLVLEGELGGRALRAALDREDARAPAPPAASPQVREGDLAYILYTSGSTGKPKGVMLSHGNALAFVDWCSRVFPPDDADRFSSHAPLHFDLSILDLYLPLTHGCTLVLVGAELGREPVGLAALIAQRKLSVWYSAPSILSMLAQFGKLARHDYSALRLVLFAGEVFPVKYLRLLQKYWPRPRYFNLYGPTETNVCTYYELPGPVPEDRTEPYPIGKVCDHLAGKLIDEQGRDLPDGAEGELVIRGANVLQGYWNLPDRTAQAFAVDGQGVRWYRTGDIVRKDEHGDYLFLGRRDRMVKRRGYRIELGDIEAGLYRHPDVQEAAVVARRDEESGARIKAFLSCKDGRTPSVIELKRFCADALPASMIPDEFAVLDALPKTSTDKIDYQKLAGM
jgi:amino acid adenylation domain-containing protein